MADAPIALKDTRGPVLVVDDDADLVTAVTESLIDEGIAAVGAHNSGSAVAAARRNPPSLVLLDFYLGEENAADVVGKLRAACGDLPIVLLSGTSAEDLPRLAGSLRLAGTLPKPCGLDVLVATVKRHRR